MKDHVRSYKDLPQAIYQFQNKFRNETRAKSGILRGREFLMKDLYSFNIDASAHDAYYESAKKAYVKIFERLGLGDRTYITFASGGSFSKYSHEFQTLCEAGEDMIYVDEKKKIAINKEVLNDEVLKDLGISKDDLVEKKAIEVGNIFGLGTKFSGALGLNYKNDKGDVVPVVMGSYGIGPSRIMGTIVEVMADEKGLVWPENLAPFDIHLVVLNSASGTAKAEADKLYSKLTSEGKEVLYDDRDCSAGEKFGDSDLIGIPLRYVISEKTLAAQSIEVKDRKTGKIELKKI